MSELDADEETIVSGVFALDTPIGVIERRLELWPGSSSRRGDVSSESDDEKLVIFGGGMIDALSGELSAFLDRKPALNLLFVCGTVKSASGGASIGEDSGD